MRNNCRVVLTDKCNLSCAFCYMKEKDTYYSFKNQTALWIAQQRYDEIGITGGEPLLELKKLVQFICLLKYFNEHSKVYLYTNGDLLNSGTAQILLTAGLDGINWSPHHYPSLHKKEEMSFVHICLIPIRILVQDKFMVYDNILQYALNNQMQIHQWSIGNCYNMELEDRFRIDWSNV